MKPFNEQAAFLIEDAVDLIKQVLIKHSAAVLEEMRDQIVARNTRIAAIEAEVEASETYCDDSGVVWTRPTAWAYAQVCKARRGLLDRAETAEAALAEAVRREAAIAQECVNAWESAVDWGGYASEYFQKKHGYEGDVYAMELARERLAAIRARNDQRGPACSGVEHASKTLSQESPSPERCQSRPHPTGDNDQPAASPAATIGESDEH